MKVFGHIAHVQMSRTCEDLKFYCPAGFGTVIGDEDSLLDLCSAGIDYLQTTGRPTQLSVYFFSKLMDGEGFIQVDLRAECRLVTEDLNASFVQFFHGCHSQRIQRACDALGAKFTLDVVQGVGLSFSVSFPNRRGT